MPKISLINTSGRIRREDAFFPSEICSDLEAELKERAETVSSSSIETILSIAEYLSLTRAILSSEAKPISYPIGVSLKSALSCLRRILYSALEVNIL